MGKVFPYICANCVYWKPYNDDEGYVEYEYGVCKKNRNTIVFGDDEKCDMFKACKRVRVKKEG